MLKDSPHLRTVANQDGAAILDTKLGAITTLNETGAFVWQGLERGDSIDSIVARLSHEANVSLEVAERDVLQFVEDLRIQRLLSH